jgi:hypothetical protein
MARAEKETQTETWGWVCGGRRGGARGRGDEKIAKTYPHMYMRNGAVDEQAVWLRHENIPKIKREAFRCLQCETHEKKDAVNVPADDGRRGERCVIASAARTSNLHASLGASKTHASLLMMCRGREGGRE